MTIVYDCETNGKSDFNAPFTSPRQPYMVQLAAVVTDNNMDVCHAFTSIIRPDGWVIPDEVVRIHGITTERAEVCGIDLHVAMAVFNNLSKLCGTRVAHNIEFDDLIINASYHRIGREWGNNQLGHCTMKTMTDYCKIPGYNGGFKWPKLAEAYKFCTGKEPEKSHDALADVLQCIEVYKWWLNNRT